MAFQMKPSADFIVYPVDLEPVDLTEMMNKLNHQLAEKRSKLASALPGTDQSQRGAHKRRRGREGSHGVGSR